jgi:hypothetical protein
MKNKNLKKASIVNLMTGYVIAIAFLVMIIANRPDEMETQVVVNDEDGLFVEKAEEGIKIALYGNDRVAVRQGSVYSDPGFKAVDSEGNDVSDQVVVTGLDKVDTNLAGFTYEIEYTYIDNNGEETKANRFVTINDNALVVDNSVYRDRLTGVVLNDADPVVAVVDNDPLYVDRDRDLFVGGRDVYVDDGDRIGAVEGGIGGGGHVGRGDRVHNRDRVDSIGVDDDGVVVDRGLLDRRLADLDRAAENLFPDVDDKKEKFGLDKDGVDLANLSVARNGDDIELGDVDDFDIDFDDNKNGKFGLNKGELYAYNFPSQGVGAGIGNSAVGAGAGGGAGLGAGIGEAVLGGTTVPTLGGVGILGSNIKLVPPGSESDSDGDGVPLETEILLGTNPNKSDTDGDGFSDGDEVSLYTNPVSSLSSPAIPGSKIYPQIGGVGGLVGGAGAGGAAGLQTAMVKKPLGMGVNPACSEHGAGCRGHGHGHEHGKREYDLPADGALHIMMHVDGSGSILDTRKQLDIMKETLLKEALLPYYNNNEDLYNKRVTIISNSGERTLKFFTEASKKDNVLAIAFQDEAQPSYHLPTFNKKPQDHYSKDLGSLKASLNGHRGLYRGVMFQVDRGNTFAKSFKEFVESAWQGTGYLENSNLKRYHWQENKGNIDRKDGIVFSDEYHAKDSGDPQYYLDLILKASKKVGLDLRAKGAGLTDGRAVHSNSNL